MRESLGTDHERYLLRMRTTTVKHMRELTTLLKPETEPDTETGIDFIASEDVTALCKNYGVNSYTYVCKFRSSREDIYSYSTNHGKPFEKLIKTLKCELLLYNY